MAENGYSLKLVLFAPAEQELGARIQRTLAQHIPSQDVLRLFDSAFLVFTEAEPATIRDWLGESLPSGRDILVVEFEHWSSLGEAVARKWLLWRGH